MFSDGGPAYRARDSVDRRATRKGAAGCEVGSGLKEALKIGTENTVKLTGRVDGYLTNLVIKLTIHEALGGRLEVSDA